ncbi:MAG: hypothetical protein HUU21_01825 [Polyangiaceae bacterium]|nr:hypothetical protein [Polyangiaceae bacterium]NUQ72273.1 hypothetical protein [Polyangiaceae bacterium]
MSYRDEREALRQRVEDLEHELARARRQIEEAQAERSKTDRLEIELAATQRTLDRIRTELRSRRPVLGGSRRAFSSPLLMVLLGMTAWSAVALGVMGRPSRIGQLSVFEPEGGMPPILAMAEVMGDRRFPRVERFGSVASVSGDAGVTVGEACSVAVKPARLGSGINCKVSVTCGNELIYGGGAAGYARCELRDGALVSASDGDPSGVDGDSAFTLDLAANRLSVSDKGDTTFELTIDLGEPDKAASP